MPAPDQVLRILIAEDDTMVREMLRVALLMKWPGAEIGEAADFASTVKLSDAGKWDMILLDLRLGAARAGLDVLEHLRTVIDTPAVLVLSGCGGSKLATRCIALGARGFIEKGESLADLLKAVERVLSGKMHVSTAVSAELALMAQGQVPEPHERLSTREFDIFLRLASGRTVTQVAEDLNRSPKTVSTHRAAILSKMQLDSTAELIRYAHENGLLG